MDPANIKHLSLDTEKHPEKDDLGGAASVTSTEATAREEGIQPIFLAKVRVLNDALAEIGMGTYQWKLFVSAGFGWSVDRLFFQVSESVQVYTGVDERIVACEVGVGEWDSRKDLAGTE